MACRQERCCTARRGGGDGEGRHGGEHAQRVALGDELQRRQCQISKKGRRGHLVNVAVVQRARDEQIHVVDQEAVPGGG